MLTVTVTVSVAFRNVSNGSNQKYYDNQAPLMIDFVHHGGSRSGITAFDEIHEQQSPTHPPSDDLNWRSSFKEARYQNNSELWILLKKSFMIILL